MKVSPKTLVEKHRSSPEGDRGFLQEQTMVRFTEMVCLMMKAHGVTITELAKRVEWTRKEFSDFLAGDYDNLTLHQASDIMWALGFEIDFSLVWDRYSEVHQS